MEEISRPAPRGANNQGVPSWDGIELGAWRRALGVRQGDVASRLAMSQPAISLIYENRRTPVRLRSDKVEMYLRAVERAAAADAQDVIDARAELAALREAKGYR